MGERVTRDVRALRGKEKVEHKTQNTKHGTILLSIKYSGYMIKVLGIKIIDRIKEAGLTQEILSRHATVITTRLGFHEVTELFAAAKLI